MSTAGRVWMGCLLRMVLVVVGVCLGWDARAQPPAACTYDPSGPQGASSCPDQLVCLPQGLGSRPILMIRAGTPGTCGRCTDGANEAERDRLCGGLKCLPSGVCQTAPTPSVPEAVWPRFHLFVTDLTFNAVDEAPFRPVLSTGYVFQGAFHKVRFEPDPQGGFVATALPRWYFDGGGLIALAGPAQNLFAQLGLTYYWPGGPVGITTVSAGALYQRQGSAIWKLGDTDQNIDRAGPVLTFGILQSLFVRASYVFAIRGPTDEGAFLISLTYMKSLVENLVPGQLIRFVPESWR
jgi:hypothetical protein